MSNGHTHMRLVNGDGVVDEQPPVERVKLPLIIYWWCAVIMVIQFFGLIVAQHDRSRMREELDNNSALIKQLQERRVVDELIGLKRKGG